MKFLSTILLRLGFIIFGLGILLFAVIYFPVLKEEVGYMLYHPKNSSPVALKEQNKKAINPIDENFGIVIPKINANAKIIANVDPYDSHVYQVALTKGIAHAKGTALPPNGGNMFLFSHSSANFYDAAMYNSIFYLLNKLSKNDTVYIFYQKKKYTYTITGTKIVDASEVSYLNTNPNDTKKTLTLMTCWPAGTSFKRLLVFGELTSEQ